MPVCAASENVFAGTDAPGNSPRLVPTPSRWTATSGSRFSMLHYDGAIVAFELDRCVRDAEVGFKAAIDVA